MSALKWILPAGLAALGGYLLRLSYTAYARWDEYVRTGDLSGAEVYEVEFWPEVTLGLLFIALAAFLAGRWSKKPKA